MKRVQMPEEYIGREHTWLKHRVLKLYLEAWAQKLGSVARYGKVRLWYVDCFAGPWKARDQSLRDTSIHIGLEALEAAAQTWGKRTQVLHLGAIFVEKNETVYGDLETFLRCRSSCVAVHALKGCFGDHVKAFFGLASSDIERGLSEVGLMNLYCAQLKKACGLRFAADLIVPHPSQERTKFRLVVGGHRPEVVRLFRQVEKRVLGQEASSVRASARGRQRAARTGQLSLFTPHLPRATLFMKSCTNRVCGKHGYFCEQDCAGQSSTPIFGQGSWNRAILPRETLKVYSGKCGRKDSLKYVTCKGANAT